MLAHSLRDDLAPALDAGELDAACGGRPVAVATHDRHTIVANDSTGGPAGLLREQDAFARWASAPAHTEPEIDAAVRTGVREAYRRGLTGVHDFQRTGGLGSWQRLSADGALAFRVWASLPVERLDEALALGIRSGLGDEWIRIGPVKAFADGTLGSRTASMLEPFSDGGTGMRLLEPGELREIVARASRGGLDVAVHAIGDRANRDVLDALEQTRELWEPAGLRPRIEHAQLLDPADLPRFSRSGSPRRCSPRTARPTCARPSGPGRGGCAAPTRSRPCTTTARRSASAPTRRSRISHRSQGVRSAVEGGLAVEAALDGFWAGAARARHAERSFGRLVPGAAADLVVLDRDPTSCPVEELDRIDVVATMVAGRWVHGAPPW